MTPAEFSRQWKRLKAAFRLAADLDPKEAEREWFRALEHYHIDAVDIGVTKIIREAEDTFWPALGVLVQAIRDRIASIGKVKAPCATCYGSTWIDALPFWANGGLLYENVLQRCPDCGVPKPLVDESGRTPLTAVEYAQWRRGELPHRRSAGQAVPSREDVAEPELLS